MAEAGTGTRGTPRQDSRGAHGGRKRADFERRPMVSGKTLATLVLSITFGLCLPAQTSAPVRQAERGGANPPSLTRDEAQPRRHKNRRRQRHTRKRGVRMPQQSKETQSRDAASETGTAAGQQKEVEVKDEQPPARRQVKRYDIKKNPPEGARRPS